MGIKLVVPEDDTREGDIAEELYMEATFDLIYDIADWFECAIHFFHDVFYGTSTTFYGQQASAWT